MKQHLSATEYLIKASLTTEKAYQKIKHFCAYRERCHHETKEKLYGMGLRKVEVETLLARLIEDDYLREERFAIRFAVGHFRNRKWGKVRIGYELKQKRVSQANIKIAMTEIDPEEYMHTLQQLAYAKWNSLAPAAPLVRSVKTNAFLIGKGFESGLVRQVLTTVKSGAAG